MKKLTTVIMVLSLVLGGVALAAAADVPQVSKNLELSALQKISDQEAQQIKGTGGFGPQFGGFSGLGNPACQQSLTTVCVPIKDQTRLQTRISR